MTEQSTTSQQPDHGTAEHDGNQSSTAHHKEITYRFDPGGAACVEHLRLARHWREQGSTYQAISVYSDMLARYRGTEAANAAAEEMLELAGALEHEGRFYTALAVVKKLDMYRL